jgi:hypothetical protein
MKPARLGAELARSTPLLGGVGNLATAGAGCDLGSPQRRLGENVSPLGYCFSVVNCSGVKPRGTLPAISVDDRAVAPTASLGEMCWSSLSKADASERDPHGDSQRPSQN